MRGRDALRDRVFGLGFRVCVWQRQYGITERWTTHPGYARRRRTTRDHPVQWWDVQLLRWRMCSDVWRRPLQRRLLRR